MQRLNPVTQIALENAAALAVSEHVPDIQVAHFLFSLLAHPNSDMTHLLTHFGCSKSLLQQSCKSHLAQHLKDNAQHSPRDNDQHQNSCPVFSTMLVEWLQEAWSVSSLDLSETHIRSGALLLTLINNPLRYGQQGYAALLTPINPDTLKQHFTELTAQSAETNMMTLDQTSISTLDQTSTARLGQTKVDQTTTTNKIKILAPIQPRKAGSALSQFTTDFTGKARQGEIDPVFCRDQAIRNMIDILARRRKNNPIVVGEPGVGKTAVVEGLALKIIKGDVPDCLKAVELYGLDMGLLQAGASVKGEFEKRLNTVLEEVKKSPIPIILFIDEAHTLVGGGNQAGSSDAANLLKPALARGDIKAIAATTWSEYKQYFEKDPALARRFQLVKLDAPSAEQTALILRGLRPAYEKSHNVYIRDDAIIAAATQSDRYISGRQLPDKAIDVLDTACARVNISLNAVPASIETLQQDIATLTRELEALKRDKQQQTGDKHTLTTIPELQARMDKARQDQTVLQRQWKEEQALIAQMIALRTHLQSLTLPISTPVKAKVEKENLPHCHQLTEAETHQAIQSCHTQLTRVQGAHPLVHFEVGPAEINHVISDWTGIPMGKMQQAERQRTLHLPSALNARIKGQPFAIQALTETLQAAQVGLTNPDAPTGVFLLVGPSGVGKTETAHAIAEHMFGGERFMTTINMSEFQERHTVSRLIGSPPGYIGYGEGGMLTEAIRQRPYSVVLLDEIEKADPEVLNLFYQVFDKGTLSDSEGREIDFKNTLIIMTSNLAAPEIESLIQHTKNIDGHAIAETIRPTLNNYFKPALLARMHVLPFLPLNDHAMSDIIIHKLNTLSERLNKHHKLALNYNHDVVKFILSHCRLTETGARNIDAVINRQLLPQLSTQLLANDKNEHQAHTQIIIAMNDQGTIDYAIS